MIFTGESAIDKRHRTLSRYYQSGTPFEHDMIRMLYTAKREMKIVR